MEREQARERERNAFGGGEDGGGPPARVALTAGSAGPRLGAGDEVQKQRAKGACDDLCPRFLH